MSNLTDWNKFIQINKCQRDLTDEKVFPILTDKKH